MATSRQRRATVAALLMLGAAARGASGAAPAEVVVATNGSAQAAGTRAEPLNSINRALALAGPGTRVVLRAGVTVVL